MLLAFTHLSWCSLLGLGRAASGLPVVADLAVGQCDHLGLFAFEGVGVVGGVGRVVAG